jgi:hypothetical protein
MVLGANGSKGKVGTITRTDAEICEWVISQIRSLNITKSNLASVNNWQYVYAGGRALPPDMESTIAGEVDAYTQRYETFKDAHPWRSDL